MSMLGCGVAAFARTQGTLGLLRISPRSGEHGYFPIRSLDESHTGRTVADAVIISPTGDKPKLVNFAPREYSHPTPHPGRSHEPGGLGGLSRGHPGIGLARVIPLDFRQQLLEVLCYLAWKLSGRRPGK